VGAFRLGSWNLGQRVARPEHVAVLEAAAPDVLALQGLTADAHGVVSGAFTGGAFGLTLRPPQPGDALDRSHACALLLGPRAEVRSFALLEGAPAPERALVAEALLDGQPLWLSSFHAPRGNGAYGRKGKNEALHALASWMREHPGPGVAGMDANSPKLDALELERSEWWSEAERELLGVDRSHVWRDVYRDVVARDPQLRAKIPSKGPLAESYRRGATQACRYDHVYVTPDVTVVSAEYRMHPGLSDHALVIAELELGAAR